VALAWILLLGGPVVAGVLAGRRYRGPGSPPQLANAKIRQGAVAGFLATGAGSLIVTVLGTGTVALMPGAAWLRHWLYPGQHLLAAAASSRELAASSSTQTYGLIMVIFPVIGLGLSVLGGLGAWGESATGQSGPRRGSGGSPGPDPAPDPPDGGRLADTVAGTGGPVARRPSLREAGSNGEPGEVLGVSGGVGVPAGLR
jgi:hypothetical protein